MLNEYLVHNNLSETFFIIQHELNLADARILLLKEKSQRLRNMILSPFDKSIPIEEYVSKTQSIQLDLISNIFMFFEDLLTFSNLLRKPLSNFYKAIVRSDTDVAADEVAFLRRRDHENTLRDILLVPKLGKLTLDMEERTFVKNCLDHFADEVLLRIKRVVDFYDDYYRIYIRYKHTLTALIGAPEIKIDKANRRKLVSSHIYIRDIEVNEKEKKETSSTYIVATDIYAVEIYDSIIEDLQYLIYVILSTQLNKLLNCGRPSLLPQIGLNGKDEERWSTIIEKTNFIVLGKLMRMITIQIKLSDKQRQELIKKGVYRSEKDLLQGTRPQIY